MTKKDEENWKGSAAQERPLERPRARRPVRAMRSLAHMYGARREKTETAAGEYRNSCRGIQKQVQGNTETGAGEYRSRHRGIQKQTQGNTETDTGEYRKQREKKRKKGNGRKNSCVVFVKEKRKNEKIIFLAPHKPINP